MCKTARRIVGLTASSDITLTTMLNLPSKEYRPLVRMKLAALLTGKAKFAMFSFCTTDAPDRLNVCAAMAIPDENGGVEKVVGVIASAESAIRMWLNQLPVDKFHKMPLRV